MESGKEPIAMKRPLKVDGIDIFVRYSYAINIIKKVSEKKEDTLDKYVSPRRPFGIDANIVKTPEFKTKKFERSISCFGKGQIYGYVSKEFIKSHLEWVNQWKIFTPRANNIGTELNDDNLNCFIGKPQSVCTESYILIGIGMNLDEMTCRNISKYLTTKFARFMHSIAKASQDATAKTYRFVPMQDFSINSDINWDKNINEIDEELFIKYELSNEEKEYIRNKIKDMA